MITIKQNEDYTKYLHLQYADTGEPLDLTGCSVYSQMRDRPNGTLVATATTSMTAASGDIWVTYAASATASITPGEYGYDVWLVDGNSKKHPLYTTRIQIIGVYTEIGG